MFRRLTKGSGKVKDHQSFIFKYQLGAPTHTQQQYSMQGRMVDL